MISNIEFRFWALMETALGVTVTFYELFVWLAYAD